MSASVITAVGQSAPLSVGLAHLASPLGQLLLARIACEGGATRTDITSELSAITGHKLSPGEWRRSAEHQLELLLAGGLATESRNRLRATEAGQHSAAQFTGLIPNTTLNWPVLRDLHLIAQGLGIEHESLSRLKMAIRPEGLRALILQTAYKLPSKKNPSLAKLRAQLALWRSSAPLATPSKPVLARVRLLPQKLGVRWPGNFRSTRVRLAPTNASLPHLRLRLWVPCKATSMPCEWLFFATWAARC